MPLPPIELVLGPLESIAAPATLAIALMTVFLAFRHAPARNLRAPAIMSSVFVLPFMVLEVVNRRPFHEVFPVRFLRSCGSSPCHSSSY
jgi:hypothetical protein